MFFPAFNLETTYVLLTVLIMARVVLYGSNLATFISLSLLSSLSFVFFESYFAFSPLVFLLLKNPFLAFFTWLKTFVSHSKECENKEKESEVLFMKGKQEPSSTFENNPDSVCDQDQAENPKRSSFVKAENDRIVVDLPAPPEGLYKGLLSTLPSLIESVVVVNYFTVLVIYFVKPMLELYKLHGHTLKGQRFVDIRALALGGFMLVFFSITKLSRTELIESIKEILRPILVAAIPIDPSPENEDTLKAVDKKVEEVLGEYLYLKHTVSGKYIRVSEQEISSLFLAWLDKLDLLVQEGKVDFDFNRFEHLPREKQILIANEFNTLPEGWKESVKEHFKGLYTKILELEGVLNGLPTSELVSSSETQSGPHSKQGNLLTEGKAPEPPYPFFKRIKAGELQDPESSNRTVRESIEQIETHLSPKASYEEFSTSVSPIGLQNVLEEKAWERLKKAKTLIAEKKEAPITDQEPTQRDFLTLSERHGSPGNSPSSAPANLGFFSTQEGTDRSVKASKPQNQLVATDQSLKKSDPFDSPGSSPSFGPRLPDAANSPLEEVNDHLGRALATLWVGSGTCAFSLFVTSQIVWVILRKLSYTQDLINKMIAKGVPTFLLSWIRHPKPGVVDGKPLFHLLVAVLVLNALILYTLVKMLYLAS